MAIELSARKPHLNNLANISVDTAIRYAWPELEPVDENELSARLATHLVDFSTTRRELVIYGLMQRNASICELTAFGSIVWQVEHFIMAHYLCEA